MDIASIIGLLVSMALGILAGMKLAECPERRNEKWYARRHKRGKDGKCVSCGRWLGIGGGKKNSDNSEIENEGNTDGDKISIHRNLSQK
jgi:hypothetical protein